MRTGPRILMRVPWHAPGADTHRHETGWRSHFAATTRPSSGYAEKRRFGAAPVRGRRGRVAATRFAVLGDQVTAYRQGHGTCGRSMPAESLPESRCVTEDGCYNGRCNQ